MRAVCLPCNVPLLNRKDEREHVRTKGHRIALREWVEDADDPAVQAQRDELDRELLALSRDDDEHAGAPGDEAPPGS